MENTMLEKLKEYFATTPQEEIDMAWAKTNELDSVGPTVEEYLESINFINDAEKTSIQVGSADESQSQEQHT
jgi:hypothetical protein